ncbi:hypothetical protein [Sulfurimonas sp.]|uniref:hypothetical protein n=1 Tax=Sulfurimonas sp. TaxID=2022749 RepID=UPI0039E512EA
MKKAIRIIVASEVIITTTSLISFTFYINLQVAFLSSLFVILGSSYAYRKMINNQIDSKSYEDKRDILDDIEDPHGLYDDEPINNAPVEELDLKQIVKEEKAKIKTLSVDSMKHGVRGASSLLRLVPYLFLVLGFIALVNNELLNIAIYLPSLLLGIIVGSITSKELFTEA